MIINLIEKQQTDRGMPPIDFIVDGTPCLLYGDDWFYVKIDDTYFKFGKLEHTIINGKTEARCFVSFPTLSVNGHWGSLTIEKNFNNGSK